MKTLGWIFLAGYAVDAVLSLTSLFVPGALPASNAIGVVMLLFAVLVFVLALTGKLAPKKLFIARCAYYLLMLVLSVVVMTLLVNKLGPDALQSEQVSPQFLRQHLEWFGPVHLATILGWVVLAVCGLAYYAKYTSRDEA